MKNITESISDVFPQGNPVIILHAHPDDESFLTAGIIGYLLENGYRCKIMYLAAALVQNESKTITRQNEAERATRFLGLESPIYLPFCEPKYNHSDANPLYLQDQNTVADTIMDALEAIEMQNSPTIVSYDINGGYGNKDHVILHQAGRILAQKHKFSLVETTINRTKMITWINDAKNRLQDNQIPQLKYWIPEFGLPEEEINYYFTLSQQNIALKRNALIQHTSQLKTDEFPLTLSLADFASVFGTEYFSMAN